MIVEIALGIVLAVIILRFWPVILALGVLGVVLVAVVAAVALLVMWIGGNDQLLTVLVVAAVVALPIWAWFSDKRMPSNSLRQKLGYEAPEKDLSESQKARRAHGYDINEKL